MLVPASALGSDSAASLFPLLSEARELGDGSSGTRGLSVCVCVSGTRGLCVCLLMSACVLVCVCVLMARGVSVCVYVCVCVC